MEHRGWRGAVSRGVGWLTFLLTFLHRGSGIWCIFMSVRGRWGGKLLDFRLKNGVGAVSWTGTKGSASDTIRLVAPKFT